MSRVDMAFRVLRIASAVLVGGTLAVVLFVRHTRESFVDGVRYE